MFKIGDYIVYGNNGICLIKDIAPLDIPGMVADNLYYVLTPIGPKESKIYSPVENQKVVMRAVITREIAEELIADVENIEALSVENEKLLEQAYKEAVASCDLRRLIGVIKMIRSKQILRAQLGKKITSTDERYLKRATDGVYGELSYVLELSREEVQERLFPTTVISKE